MENRSCLFVAFVVITLPCFVAQSDGIKSQGEALDNLYKAKFSRDSSIDTSPFEQVIDIHQSEEMIMNMVLYKSKDHYPRPAEGSSKEKDRIKTLPGQPPVNFSQYGGYVTVNETSGTAFYYYFVEADQHSQQSLPLLLWLNGGPGCSSLAYGAMQELGPFRVYSDGKTLYKNQYSWNKAANVLFVESPAGVGFSYSNASEKFYKNGDRQTATENYMFLVNWLERFPEYKNRDFYIAGESYAGHYVPQLAHNILHYNKKANRTVVNLKGILIGNAVIDDNADNQGMYDYFGTHALTSNENFCKIQRHCNFSSAGVYSSECQAAINEADVDVNDIDIYNIYAPLCFSSNLTSKPKKTSLMNFDPCSDYYVIAYLNRPDVQEAIHANVTKITYDWQPCTDIYWADSVSTTIPLLKELMGNGLRLWVFSGDTDGRVPVTSSQYSINRMNLPIKTEWHPWFFNQEVGGYIQVYKGDLTLATVRGAGHMVPSYQPARALSLITHFLSGTTLPKPKSKHRA